MFKDLKITGLKATHIFFIKIVTFVFVCLFLITLIKSPVSTILLVLIPWGIVASLSATHHINVSITPKKESDPDEKNT